jgi:catecholate siderophore receptor
MPIRRRPLAAALVALFATPMTPVCAADPPPPAATEAPNADPIAASTVRTLPEVNVNARSDPYAPGVSTIGGKVPTETRDIPQVVTVIPRAVLDAQGASSLADALRYVPGITIGGAEGGQIGTNINLRGFTARTDIFLDGSRDRGQYYRDTFFLDAVEVLEGPSSLLFGRGSTGGVVNQTSKAPLSTPRNEVSASAGTHDYYRITGDFNAPFSDTGAFRMNAMAQDVGSTRDIMRNRDFGMAPTASFGMGTATQVNVAALVTHNRDMPDYGLPPLDGAPAPVSYSNFYGLTDDRTVQDVAVGSLRVQHAFDNGLTLRNHAQYSHYGIDATETGASRVGTYADGRFTPLSTADGNATNLPASALSVLLGSHDRTITDDAFDNQTDFIADFATGSVRHSLLFGGELGHDRYDNQAYQRVDPGITGATGLAVVALDHPAYGPAPANAVRTTGNRVSSSADTLAAYVNDTAELDEHWKMVLGLRWDRFKADIRNSINSDNTPGSTAPPSASQTVTFTSVRAGVIHQPTRALSTYAAYGTSFDPSLETLTLTSGQQDLSPEENRSYEVGAKWDVADGLLSLSSALFQVEKTNARTQVSTGVYELDGEVRVRGLELAAAGSLARDWRIIAGYTYLDATIVSASAFENTQGNVPANTPRNSASLWTTYRLGDGWEIGGGTTYMSSRYASNTNVVVAPEAVRLDAMLAYHQPRYDVRLNLFNVTDRDYIAALIPSDGGRSVPGIGRTFVVTFVGRF